MSRSMGLQCMWLNTWKTLEKEFEKISNANPILSICLQLRPTEAEIGSAIFQAFFFSIQYFLCVWSELVLHVSEILLWCHKVCTQTCILKHLRSSISTLVVPILRLCLCDAGSNTLFKAVDRNQKIAFVVRHCKLYVQISLNTWIANYSDVTVFENHLEVTIYKM